MSRILNASDFQDPDTVALARRLLGTVLASRQADGSVLRRRIIETEAYHGFDDLASHAARGRTPRNAPMFEAGGLWYVYLCYGIHEMLNLVTGPEGFPAAILLRGVEGAVGPGRLTRALGIDRRLNTLPADPATGLWLEAPDDPLHKLEIVASPRVGVGYAGPVWAARPWRFRISLNSVSDWNRSQRRERRTNRLPQDRGR